MAGHQGQPLKLTRRQAEIAGLVATGLRTGEIAQALSISPRTVEGHISVARTRTGVRTTTELVARCCAAGVFSAEPVTTPRCPVCAQATPQPDSSGTPAGLRDDGRRPVPKPPGSGTAPAGSGLRIGYARLSAWSQDNRAQLDRLTAATCHKILRELATASGGRPQLRRALGMLSAGDTLVVCKPGHIASSVKELSLLLEDRLFAHGIGLHVLSGRWAGLHRPGSAHACAADLLAAAAMAAELERELIRERTLDGLHAARARGVRGGRPAAVSADVLAAARGRRDRGEPVAAIARSLGIGRSTLYRALNR